MKRYRVPIQPSVTRRMDDMVTYMLQGAQMVDSRVVKNIGWQSVKGFEGVTFYAVDGNFLSALRLYLSNYGMVIEQED